MKGTITLAEHEVVLKASVAAQGLGAYAGAAGVQILEFKAWNQALKRLQKFGFAEGALVLAEPVAPVLGEQFPGSAVAEGSRGIGPAECRL